MHKIFDQDILMNQNRYLFKVDTVVQWLSSEDFHFKNDPQFNISNSQVMVINMEIYQVDSRVLCDAKFKDNDAKTWTFKL